MSAEAYNFFEGTQTDINRRFLRKIEKLEKENQLLVERIEALENS